MNRLRKATAGGFKAGFPKDMTKRRRKKSKADPAPSSLAAYGPGAPPLQFQRSSQSLPPLVEDCLLWLDTHHVWEVEGIFRISGDFHEIKRILRKYAKGKKVKLDEETTGLRAHTVACLLKTYLRELPIPLLTFELYDTFLSAISIEDHKTRLELIKTTMALLPPANKALLTRLLGIMRKVADHADLNKMHAQNLAIVFAPCLLRPMNDNLMTALLDGGVSQTLLSTMIQNYAYFFIEENDKTETTKQFTGEHKEFYKTLKKGTLRLAASMAEEKRLLQRLKEGAEADEVESDSHSTSTSEIKSVDYSSAEVSAIDTPPPIAAPNPRARKSLPPLSHSTANPLPPLRECPPRPPPSELPVSPTGSTENNLETPTRTSTAPKMVGHQPRKKSGTEQRKENSSLEKKAPPKQISMSWSPAQARRELSASGKEENSIIEATRTTGKERPRSPHTHAASIRRRLKVSSISSSDSDDDSYGDSEDSHLHGGATRPLIRSGPPAVPTTCVSGSGDSDESSSSRASMRSRTASGSDTEESGEEKQHPYEEQDDPDEVEVVTKRTTTFLTPEQMVKLVRQQRVQQRKELLARKKERFGSKAQRRPKSEEPSDSDESSSRSLTSSDEDDECDEPTRKPSPSTSTTSKRKPLPRGIGRSMPTRHSPSPTSKRLAASLPAPNETKEEGDDSTSSSATSSSSECEEEEEEQVRRLLNGDLDYFERLVAPKLAGEIRGQTKNQRQPSQADLSVLAKDVHLTTLDHFQ